MSPFTNTATTVERDVALEGDPAVTWLTSLGWSVGAQNGRLRLFADLIRHDPFAVGRIWHDPATLTFVGQRRWHESAFLAILGVEGKQRLEVGARSIDLGPGQIYVHPLRQTLTITSTEAVARIVLVSDWSNTHGPYPHSPREGLFEAHAAYNNVFLAAVNAALNSVTQAGDGTGFNGFRHAIEHLFISSLIGDQDQRPGQPPESTPVLTRAAQLIHAHAGNPAFDVAALARALSLSPASLYRAYEGADMAPAAQLRAARVERARDLLGHEATEIGTSDLKGIAEMAGFGSIRALRRALASDGTEQEEQDTSRPNTSAS